jgi:SAM-dependent methyltransferase
MSFVSRLAAFYRGEGIGRVLMNEAIARTVALDGFVVDIGGKGNPSYRRLIEQPRLLDQPACCRLLVFDLIPHESVDVVGSITRLPLPARACDALLCFNVLEHVFDHAAALRELRRVMKPGGVLYGRVPFLVGIHGDPHDYWRFTPETLARLLGEAGFTEVAIETHGGLFLAIGNLLWPLFRFALLRAVAGGLVLLSDCLFAAVAGRARNQERFPLGYYFVAH